MSDGSTTLPPAMARTLLSSVIKRDLVVCVSDGTPLPYALTLSSISDHYGVSVTPVRQAVAELIRAGVLNKLPNGRLELRSGVSAHALAAASGPHPSGPGRADLEILVQKHVIELGLAGEAKFLREEATAESFGVGRTALRQTFGRLAERGLLIHRARRGWEVRTFNLAEIESYLDVRDALETLALSKAFDRLDRDRLAEYREGNLPGPDDEPRIDNRLHQYWIDLSGNATLQRFFERQGQAFNLLFDYAAPEADAVRAMAAEHVAILDAAIAGDLERCCRENSRHIASQKTNLQKLLAKRRAPASRSA
jgi:DNA-binding GntR family transcriptional regulator